jgi:hypothetical protein
MQNMDSLGSSKNKLFFKKRTHRPWKATLMENSVDESSIGTMDTEDLLPIEVTHLDFHEEKMKIAEPLPTSLEQTLEDKKTECLKISEELTDREENRLVIGGFIYPRNIFFLTEEEKIQKTNFLMNELKSKEQEILLLAHDLKVAKALEQAENAEAARRKEEEARLAAEERALFAIQQAKQTAEQVYKAEKQLNLEKHLRLEIEKAKTQQEEKIKTILKEVEKKEQKILEETLAKQTAEEKAKYALEYASVTEQNAKKEVAEKIAAAERLAIETIAKIEREANEEIAKAKLHASETIAKTEFLSAERIKKVEFQYDKKTKEAAEKVQHAQMQTEQKIQKTQELIRFNEKARLNAQAEMQKALETAQRLESAKKETEEKLEAYTKDALDRQIIADRRIDDLLLRLQLIEQDKNAIEKERMALEGKYHSASEHLKKIETVIGTEKNLRKILEEKNIMHLKQIKEHEAHISLVENKLSTTIEQFKEAQNMYESQKKTNEVLDFKLNEFIQRIQELELIKQRELEYFQNEKAKLEEQLSEATRRLKELEFMIESEKDLRKEAEYARVSAEEKINRAIEQASKTVLNVLHGPENA